MIDKSTGMDEVGFTAGASLHSIWSENMDIFFSTKM